MKIARGSQRPGQTREQTKLIAQGIQKGIDQYKKQQKARNRELDRQRKRSSNRSRNLDADTHDRDEIHYRQHWLPWLLLAVTWLAIALYFLVFDR